MNTAYLAVTLTAIVANGFSGLAALFHFQPIMAGMANAGVPVSWLTFPIGTSKTLGALGLVVGMAVPPVGVAAASGLVAFFVCAVFVHVRARDVGPQFGLAIAFLLLNCLTLAMMLTA